MKRYFHKLKQKIENKFFSKKESKQNKDIVFEDFSLIKNFDNKDYILSFWMNKDNLWTHIVQIRKEGVLTSTFNKHPITSRKLYRFGIFFIYNEFKDTLVQVKDENDPDFIPFVTGISISFTERN